MFRQPLVRGKGALPHTCQSFERHLGARCNQVGQGKRPACTLYGAATGSGSVGARPGGQRGVHSGPAGPCITGGIESQARSPLLQAAL